MADSVASIFSASVSSSGPTTKNDGVTPAGSLPPNAFCLRIAFLASERLSGPAKHTTAALSGLERNIASLGKKGAPGAKNLVGQLEYLRKKAVQVGQFKELRAGMKQTAEELRQAKIRVDQLKTSIAGMSKPSDKMRRELRSAEYVVRMLGSSFREQAAAARRAETGLRSFGLNSRSAIMESQNAIRSQMAQTIQKMREFDREARKSRPPRGGGIRSAAAEAAVAAGGATAVHTGRRAAAKGFRDAVDYNQVKAFRDALGGAAFNPSSISSMNKQAEQIAIVASPRCCIKLVGSQSSNGYDGGWG